MNYIIVESNNQVEFISDVRLPFEPRGAARTARNELRAALGRLVPTGTLAATYTSAAAGLCDVENVLLYNVGMGAFAALGKRRISLTRRHEMPPGELQHHHLYRVADPNPQPSTGRLVAEATFALPVRKAMTASMVWLAARPAIITSCVSLTLDLALAVRLFAPATSHLTLPSTMKPLLDGFLAACHRHDGSHRGTVVRRLAARLEYEAQALESLLHDGAAPLGERGLVHPWGDSVQWNPADDRLTAIDISLEDAAIEDIRCEARVLERQT